MSWVLKKANWNAGVNISIQTIHSELHFMPTARIQFPRKKFCWHYLFVAMSLLSMDPCETEINTRTVSTHCSNICFVGDASKSVYQTMVVSTSYYAFNRWNLAFSSLESTYQYFINSSVCLDVAVSEITTIFLYRCQKSPLGVQQLWLLGHTLQCIWHTKHHTFVCRFVYAHHFWSPMMHVCTDSCDISFVLCMPNDLYVYQRQIRGVLLYSACIQIFVNKSFWCIVDFHAKQHGTFCEHCNHDNQSGHMLLVHPRMRVQSSPLDIVYLIMLLTSYPKESYQ